MKKKAIVISLVMICLIITVSYVKSNKEKMYYHNLNEDDKFIEIFVKNDFSYDVYKYDTLEDYYDKSNKYIVASVEHNPENETIIGMQDIVKNDYTGNDNSYTIITEDFAKDHYMYLDLNEDISDLVTITSANEQSNINFYIGIPISETKFKLIPLYSVGTGDNGIENRIEFENYEYGYKLFANVEDKEDDKTALIVSNRTESEKNLKGIQNENPLVFKY